MCHGNLGEASIRYINAQLLALWQNAKDCNDKEGLGKVPKDDIVKHGIALHEFHGPWSKIGNTTTFHAVFKAPRVEFLCDHELVLYLQFEQGHYEVSG
jgi:hypothetical protein